MMVVWLCWISWGCIFMSILYRTLVVVPFSWVRLVLQCLHCSSLCSIVWSGSLVIFSPCPLCPF